MGTGFYRVLANVCRPLREVQLPR